MTHWDYDRLYELLVVVSNFDPKFEIPYLLGGLILGESPPHAPKALHVLGRAGSSSRSTGGSPSTWIHALFLSR